MYSIAKNQILRTRILNNNGIEYTLYVQYVYVVCKVQVATILI